jgi:hypothetical protein
MSDRRFPQVGEEWRFRFGTGGTVEVRGLFTNRVAEDYVVVEYIATGHMLLTELKAFLRSYLPPVGAVESVAS